ncbi:hypothetical protein [Heyndrickxia oleronia]|uniref:Uncharacterized protein n=1 Tax=Heyndrickxia oleronia TaxID=38875 RepID=A0AAW6SNN1_9BACI|nr:hypothetical protein [Heyndrickxia oleronia]MDH5160359.1 hypothetical protein [Heyndrickxia oleronia]
MITEIFDLIKSFEGIIGALLGTLLTLIVTHILSKTGKVTSNIVKTNFEYLNYHTGFGEPVNTVVEADHASIEITVDFFNNSESYKSINDIVIILCDNSDNEIHKIIPKDIETRRSGSHSVYYDDLEYINIGPNELIKKGLRFGFNTGDIELLKNTDYFKLIYSVHKRSAKSKKVITKIINF